MAHHLGLPVQPSPHLNVIVGNGDSLQCAGLCSQIPIQLALITFNLDLYLLPIYGVDLVFGVQWLADLGEVVFEYRKLYMTFHHDGAQVILHGLKPAQLSQLSLAQLKWDEQTTVIASLYHISMITIPKSSCSQSPSAPTPEVVMALRSLLDQFASMFATPKRLPPSCEFDHSIPLISNIAPINVRPYRYPYYQKSEIEKLIREMEEGIIRPSTNPFSSPVLLVKKKDRS